MEKIPTIMILLLAFPIIGVIMILRSSELSKKIKVLSVLVLAMTLIYSLHSYQKNEHYKEQKLAVIKKLKLNNETLNSDWSAAYDELSVEKDDLSAEFKTYKSKMKKYETIQKAEADKVARDSAAAEKVNKKIKEIPLIENLTLDNAQLVQDSRALFNALSTQQKTYVDATSLDNAERQLKKLQKQAEEKAAADAKQAEINRQAEEARKAEEAKGYETGITYDQLARTPDSFKDKKVKFYGKVLQVMTDEYTTQIRLAVNDDYDQYLPNSALLLPPSEF